MPHSTTYNHNNSPPQRTVLLATDHKNSVLAELAGGKPNPIAYCAYGQQSAQQEIVTRLGFNGELRETRVGWYLLGNGYRAYNPRLMRFHSPDNVSPFGKGGLNAYMYCGGEPVMNKDPTGHNFYSAVLNNLLDRAHVFLDTLRAQMALDLNPVKALVSSISSTGNVDKRLLDTLGAANFNGFSMRGTVPSDIPVNAKKGWLHSKVGGVPSSTPDLGTNASLPDSSGGASAWDRIAAREAREATLPWTPAGTDRKGLERVKLNPASTSTSTSTSTSSPPTVPPRQGVVRDSQGRERVSLQSALIRAFRGQK